MNAKKRIEKEIPYSEAIKELEMIVARLQRGEVEIDKLPLEVERGAELIAMCKEKLRLTQESIDTLFNNEK